MKKVALPVFAAMLAACGAGASDVNEEVLAAVKGVAGESPELEFSTPMWCSQVNDGNRAAMVAAAGPVMAGVASGAGGYLVEVLADGSVQTPVKASPPDPTSSPSSEALRIDRAYCEGKLVAGPYEALNQLRNMNNGQF